VENMKQHTRTVDWDSLPLATRDNREGKREKPAERTKEKKKQKKKENKNEGERGRKKE
jgi:hypothetical protein